MPTPSARQLDLLGVMVDESGRRTTVQLSGSFAYNEDEPPPLRQLLSMGSVALKLYLTLVMATAKPPSAVQRRPRPPAQPHELYKSTSAARFARMLGFDDAEHDNPASPGTRRVQRALAALNGQEFIVRTPRRGKNDKIEVHHRGNYAPPYITLSLDLWRRGWMNAMSNPALAVYIALRRHCAGKEDAPIHVTPAMRRQGYQISEDTWATGLKDLAELGLVTLTKDNPDDREALSRQRGVYKLHSERMAHPPSR